MPGGQPTAGQRQFLVFAPLAAALVLLLAISANSHGALHTVGLIVGLPIVAVLLIVALRLYRKTKEPN
jgi:choline-glycine betaine transporter